jgi:hypothetical protein
MRFSVVSTWGKDTIFFRPSQDNRRGIGNGQEAMGKRLWGRFHLDKTFNPYSF